KAFLLGQGTPIVGPSVRITFGFLAPTSNDVVGEVAGIRVLLNRLIVDLVDFQSFDAAAQIGQQLRAQLLGHFPYSNSYVFDLTTPAGSFSQLQTMARSLRADTRVADVWFDVVLEPFQVKFADTDWMDRYRQSAAPTKGREDAW